MKIDSTKNARLIHALIAVMLFSAASAHATLLVYEGFNGYRVGDMVAQSAVNTIGLTGSYAEAAYNYQDYGLSFGSLAVSGGAVVTNNSWGRLNIGLSSSAATTGTLYGSYLYQTSTANNTSNMAIGIGSSEHFISYASFPAGAAAQYGDSSSNTRADTWVNLQADTTYICITKITNVGMTISSVAPGTLTSCFLTLDQYSAWELSGMNESYLSLTTVGTGANQITARAKSTATSGTYLFDNTQTLVIDGWRNPNAVIDEIRFGTELGDVVLIVPEPSVLLLLVAGGIALIANATRRSIKRASHS